MCLLCSTSIFHGGPTLVPTMGIYQYTCNFMQFSIDCTYLQTENGPRCRVCPRLCENVCVHGKCKKPTHTNTHPPPPDTPFYKYTQT